MCSRHPAGTAPRVGGPLFLPFPLPRTLFSRVFEWLVPLRGTRPNRPIIPTTIFTAVPHLQNGVAYLTIHLISIHLGPRWVPSTQPRLDATQGRPFGPMANKLRGSQEPEVAPSVQSPQHRPRAQRPSSVYYSLHPGKPQPYGPIPWSRVSGSGGDRPSSSPSPGLLPV